MFGQIIFGEVVSKKCIGWSIKKEVVAMINAIIRRIIELFVGFVLYVGVVFSLFKLYFLCFQLFTCFFFFFKGFFCVF